MNAKAALPTDCATNKDQGPDTLHRNLLLPSKHAYDFVSRLFRSCAEHQAWLLLQEFSRSWIHLSTTLVLQKTCC